MTYYTRTCGQSRLACETGWTKITLLPRPPLAKEAVGDIFEGFRHTNQHTEGRCSSNEYQRSYNEDGSKNGAVSQYTFINHMRLNQATITTNDSANFAAVVTKETEYNYSSEIVSKIIYTQLPLPRGIHLATVDYSPVATDKWKENCIIQNYGGKDCPMHHYVRVVNLKERAEGRDNDEDWQQSVVLSTTAVVEVRRTFLSPTVFWQPEIQIIQKSASLGVEKNPYVVTSSLMTYNSNNSSFEHDCGLNPGLINLKANQAIMTELASKLPEPRTCHLTESELPSPYARSERMFSFISSNNVRRMKIQTAFVPVRCYLNLWSQAVERMMKHPSGSLEITPVISLSKSGASGLNFPTSVINVRCSLYTPTNLRGVPGCQLLADDFESPEKEYAVFGQYSLKSSYSVAQQAQRPNFALSRKIIRETAGNVLSQIKSWTESTKKSSNTQGSSTPYVDKFAATKYSCSIITDFVIPYTVQNWIPSTSSGQNASPCIRGLDCTVELDTSQMDRTGQMEPLFTKRHTLNTADGEDALVRDSYVTLSNDRFFCNNLLTNQREPLNSLTLPVTYEQRNELRSAPTSIKSQDQIYFRPSAINLQGDKLCQDKSWVKSQQHGKQSEAIQSQGWNFRDQGRLKEYPNHHSREHPRSSVDILLNTEDELSEPRGERRSKHWARAQRQNEGNSVENVHRFGDSSDKCSKTGSLYNEGPSESEKWVLCRETKCSAADSRARKRLTNDSEGRKSHFKKANRRASTSRSPSCSDSSSPSFRKPRKNDRGERSQSYTRRSVKSLLRQYERLTKQLVQTNKSIVEACGRKKLRFGQAMNEYLSSTSEGSTSVTQKNSPGREVTNPTKAILKRLDKLCSTVLDVSRMNNRTAEPAVLTETSNVPWGTVNQADQLKSLFAHPTLNPNLLSAGNEIQTPLDSTQSIPFGKHQLTQSQHQLQEYGNHPPGNQIAAEIMAPNDFYGNQWAGPAQKVPVRKGRPAQRYHSTIPWSHRATELPLPDDTSQDDTDSHRRSKSRKRLKKKSRKKSDSRRAACLHQKDFPLECKEHVNRHQHPYASYYGSQLPVYPNDARHMGCCHFGHQVNPVHTHSQQNMHRIQSVGPPPPCHTHHLKCIGHPQVIQLPSSSSILSRTTSYSLPSYSIPHHEPCKHVYQPNLSSHIHAVSQSTASSCCVDLQSKMCERPPNLPAQALQTSCNQYIDPGIHVKPTSEKQKPFSYGGSLFHSIQYQQPSDSSDQVINGYWDGKSSVNTADAPTAPQRYSMSESSHLPAGFCGSGLPRSPIRQNAQTEEKFVNQELPVSNNQLTRYINRSVSDIFQQQVCQNQPIPRQPRGPNANMSFDGVDEKELFEKGNDLWQAQKQGLSTNGKLLIRAGVEGGTPENIRINEHVKGPLGQSQTHIINQNTSHVMSSHASDQQSSSPPTRSVIAMRANLASDPTTPEDWQQVEAKFDELQREKTRIEGRLCRTPQNGRENAETKRLTEYLVKLDAEISALKLLLLRRFSEMRKRNTKKG